MVARAPVLISLYWCKNLSGKKGENVIIFREKKTGEKGERKIGVLYTLPNMMGASFTTKTLEVGYLRKHTKKVSTKISLFCKLFEMKLKQKKPTRKQT